MTCIPYVWYLDTISDAASHIAQKVGSVDLCTHRKQFALQLELDIHLLRAVALACYAHSIPIQAISVLSYRSSLEKRRRADRELPDA